MFAPEFESTLPMFFFDWNFFAQLCGASSLNAVILPKEIRLPLKQGGNEPVHKDFRKWIAQQKLSKKRGDRLFSSYLEHCSERNFSLDADTIGQLREIFDLTLSDKPRLIPLSDVRMLLQDSLPETLPPKTRDHVLELLLVSLSVQARIEKEGPSALLCTLKEADDPTWDPFLSEMARRLKGANEVPTDVSAALQIMCGLSLFFMLWFELLEREKTTSTEKEMWGRASIKIFFAVENDQARPKVAVANLLNHILDKSRCETKIDFIKEAFGGSVTQVREAHKFFEGTEIPTFKQTKSAIQASIPSDLDSPNEHDFLVMIVQFISRSYRHLEERLDEPLADEIKPHAIFFRKINDATQAHRKVNLCQ